MQRIEEGGDIVELRSKFVKLIKEVVIIKLLKDEDECATLVRLIIGTCLMLSS